MTTFYLTFGQQVVGLSNGWVEAVAGEDDETRVRLWARETYGDLWSGIYREDEHAPEHYPHGCLGRVTFG